MYVGIVLKKDQYVFLVKRRDAGGWSFPGGTVESGETLAQAALREIAEEVGVQVDQTSMRLVHVLPIKADGINKCDVIGFYFLADSWQGTAKNNEPERHSAAQWFHLDELPADIILERTVVDSLTAC